MRFAAEVYDTAKRVTNSMWSEGCPLPKNDIYQECCLVACKLMPRYDPSLSKVKTFLWRPMRQNIQRKLYQETRASGIVLPELWTVYNYDNIFDTHEMLRSLPEEDRSIMIGRYVYNRTMTELSQEHEISVSTLNRRLKQLTQRAAKWMTHNG